MALVIALLEDRPAYLFDEWAADQDPFYRDRFYYEILPALRATGKLCIAVTHDEAYFHCCDRRFEVSRGVPREMPPTPPPASAPVRAYGAGSFEPPHGRLRRGRLRRRVCDVSVEAGGDAAEVLEPAEGALDDVAVEVDGFFTVGLELAVALRRDDRLDAARRQPVAQRGAIVTLVGDQVVRGRYGLEAEVGGLAVQIEMVAEAGFARCLHLSRIYQES